MSVKFTAGGMEFSFTSYSGTVIADKRLSETHITTSGGGGTIRNGEGSVAAPTVRSNVVTNQDIWLRDTAGRERVLRLKGCDIPVLENHRISVVVFQCGGDANEILLFNHNMKTWHNLCSLGNYAQRYGLPVPFGGLAVVLAIVAGISLWSITGFFIVALITSVVVYCWIDRKQAPVERGYKEQYDTALQAIRNEVSRMG